MKATTTILAVVFTLSMNFLFAGNDRAAVNRESSSLHTSFSPGTPSVATFEEMIVATTPAFILTPVTPIEVESSDAVSESTINISALAPVTPGEADFTSDDEAFNVRALSPVTPSVADFSDGI